MEKHLDVTGIERIVFLADDVFKIKITTVNSTSLILRASVAGEHAENVVIDIKQTINSLTITPGFTPFFIQENDKLAAHKVMAIELEVLVPENRDVSISSKIASVACFGNYTYFQAYLDQGTCTLGTFKGDGMIQTKKGNVSVSASKDVGVLAFSKTGIMSGKPYQEQFYKLEIKTVSGDITILETN